MTKRTKREGTRHAKSATRSATLTGRESARAGQRQLPVQSRLVGLTPRPKPDPKLKPWPSDAIVIVASTPMSVNVRGIREYIVDEKCKDCGCRLAVDQYSIRVALEMPERQARPLRFMCVQCCTQYDRTSIQTLVDK